MKAVASALQVSGNMSQKLQAMQCGVHELREMTQVCQSIIDAGPASADSDASQQCQRGWHLAKKCSGWANEVQVCYTAAPGHTAVLCCAALGHMAVLCCAVLCCAVLSCGLVSPEFWSHSRHAIHSLHKLQLGQKAAAAAPLFNRQTCSSFLESADL